jgi:hypothetical protein
MKQRIQGMVIGIIAAFIFTSAAAPALAGATTRQLNAWFNNIKIVVDGELIVPKDSEGRVIEPFIIDGTAYLPVRAVGEALGKSVDWDGATNTVFLGGADKPATAVPVYSRQHIEYSPPGDFRARAEYVGFRFCPNSYTKSAGQSEYEYNAHVEYPLNGAAAKLTGTILAPRGGIGLSAVYTFSDESGRVLYKSPVMLGLTDPVDFEIDVSGCLTVRIELLMRRDAPAPHWVEYFNDCLIQDLMVTTTDY